MIPQTTSPFKTFMPLCTFQTNQLESWPELGEDLQYRRRHCFWTDTFFFLFIHILNAKIIASIFFLMTTSSWIPNSSFLTNDKICFCPVKFYFLHVLRFVSAPVFFLCFSWSLIIVLSFFNKIVNVTLDAFLVIELLLPASTACPFKITI